jgi:phosphopantothenoylcysteine decarboxylase/phosphopantothenate--cysteine ligase
MESGSDDLVTPSSRGAFLDQVPLQRQALDGTLSPGYLSPGGVENSDLRVEEVSHALRGLHLDCVVSGSIAAVESIRFIRMLRRLGAVVTPWLTEGGRQFVTPLSLAWAAARDVRFQFEGSASHIALGDACIVAPASANLLSSVAMGLTATPATALVASYLGVNKPVIMLPTMHESLKKSPAVSLNLDRLKTFGVEWIASRSEEGKEKFPDPEIVANSVSHLLNKHKRGGASVFVTMGTTRGFIDEVRYVSNYSSGKLGTLIAEELYRQGYQTDVISGPCYHQPRSMSQLKNVSTNDEMESAVKQSVRSGASGGVFAASVLDFIPEKTVSGKLASKDHPHLTLQLKRTEKIISGIHLPAKVGFKLEVDLKSERMGEIVRTYMDQYGLTMMVVNDLRDVSESQHRAFVFETEVDELGATSVSRGTEVIGKLPLAHRIVRHIASHLNKSDEPPGIS